MKPRKARVAVLIVLVLAAGSGVAGYLILLSPGSIWVRWAQAAFPQRMTMITFGPYPSAKQLKHFKQEGGKYVVSLLDPRLPYEKQLLEREAAEGSENGLVFKDFPMASIFDRRIFTDYQTEEQKAVDFLRHLDGPAYVHCYLGKHRVIHVRDALLQAGVPASYWTPAGSKAEYWDLVSRLADARREFGRNNFAKALEILEPVTAKDVDVAFLRGWSHYRLGLFTQAAEDFSRGLEADPSNKRCLEGLGYCYVQQQNPVMAQRQFNRVLEESPKDEGALVGQGLAFLALRNNAAAVQAFREVLAMDPGNQEVENYLKRAEAE